MYTEDQVKELLRKQRENCAEMFRSHVTRASGNNSECYKDILSATEPTLPENPEPPSMEKCIAGIRDICKGLNLEEKEIKQRARVLFLMHRLQFPDDLLVALEAINANKKEDAPGIDFQTFKEQFDASFSKVKPSDFIKQMESKGVEFETKPIEVDFSVFRRAMEKTPTLTFHFRHYPDVPADSEFIAFTDTKGIMVCSDSIIGCIMQLAKSFEAKEKFEKANSKT